MDARDERRVGDAAFPSSGHRMMVATNWPELETSTALMRPVVTVEVSERTHGIAVVNHDRHVVQSDVMGTAIQVWVPKPLPVMVMGLVGQHIGLAGVQLSAAEGDLAVSLRHRSFHQCHTCRCSWRRPNGVDPQSAFEIRRGPRR